jgi:SH3-like domain-containing protein
MTRRTAVPPAPTFGLRWLARRVAPCLVGVLGLPAWAIDYLSLAESAVMYDAPSAKAKPLFVIARGTPVESVVVVGAWVKVRDARGDLAWVEKAQLAADRRTVIVRARLAQIRNEASDTAPLVFEAETDVVLDFVAAAAPGWAQVRHADGQSGFVRLNQIWGA